MRGRQKSKGKKTNEKRKKREKERAKQRLEVRGRIIIYRGKRETWKDMKG